MSIQLRWLSRLLCVCVILFSQNAFSLSEGSTVPEMTLPLLSKTGEKKTLNLRDYRGKVVYVDFWASWCGPCRKSMPFLQELRAKYNAKGFEVIAVNVDENPEDAFKFLDKVPVSYPVVSDPKAKYPEVFKVQGMPTAYVVDKQGVVRKVHKGFNNSDKAEIEDLVVELLAGRR